MDIENLIPCSVFQERISKDFNAKFRESVILNIAKLADIPLWHAEALHDSCRVKIDMPQDSFKRLR
jgi:hypothetical protein